jgi:putative flippase GtrA
MKKLLREITLFGLVGVAGFAVDTAVLYLLRDWLGPLIARVPSFLLAVVATWWLNRCFTFRERPSGLQAAQEFRRYLALMLSGGAVNYAVFATLLFVSETARAHPVIGVAAGSLAGMGANLLASRLFLFR